MTLLTEEQKEKLLGAGLKVPIVNESCIGCGACVAITPEVFEMNDEWMSVVIARDSYENTWVEDSIWACPVDAISVEW